MEIINPIALAIGIVLCLFGWALYWIGIHLTGAIAGAIFGAAAAWLAMTIAAIPPAEARWILPLAGAVGFCLGIFFMRGVHRFFFFFLGAAIGIALGHTLFQYLLSAPIGPFGESPNLWQGVFLVAGTILGGLAMARGSRWVVTALTSLVGAALVGLSFSDPLALVLAPALALAAFFMQTGLLRRVAPAPQRKENEKDEN